MVGYIHIGEILALLIYALIFIGVGALVRNYPETIAGINTMPKAKRERLDLHKIGAFCSKWLNAAAVVVLLSGAIPYERLRWEVAIILPIFLLMICSAYLIKYQNTRFKKEE